MPKYEKKIINFIEEHFFIFAMFIITIFALLLRFFMLDHKTLDFIWALEPWFDYLKNNGGIYALKSYIGDYNAPYMTAMALLTYIPIKSIYLIKGLSIIFDFALAISSAMLVKYLLPNNKKNIYSLITYASILFLPEVFMNSALWAQSDAGYTTFVILSLLFLLKEKNVPAFILLGIAFSIKLQFIFVLPLFIIIYVSKKNFSIFNFLIIPLVDIILCLPAIIMGRPIKSILSVYYGQMVENKAFISMNLPNFYEIFSGDPVIITKIAIILTMCICIGMLLYVMYNKTKWNNEKIITLALWFSLIVPYFLPRMHDRYFFMAAIIALIRYIVYKKNLPLTIILIISPIITYCSYIFKTDVSVNLTYISIALLILLIYFTKDTLKLLRNNNT